MATVRCPTVLHIDDDPDILKLMEHVFACEDFHPIPCRTPEDGLEILRGRHVDCILIDIHFARTPECFGFLCAVRALPGMKNLPILATSTMTEHEMAARVLDLGARKFIPKPYYPREVLQEVRALFS